MEAKSKRGGARKNAGRKSNAHHLLVAGFTAPWWTPEQQKNQWTSFLTHPDAKIRLDAAKYLADRLYGKAHQTVDTTLNGELQLKLAERIAQARKR